MRRLILVALAAFSLTLITNNTADAQRGYGGGFDGYGFGGGGYRGGGYRAVSIEGSRWGRGVVRPGWYAMDRPAWRYARPVWGGGNWAGYRPGWGYGPNWGYHLPAYGAGFGLAMAAYYGDTYYYRPYGHHGCGYSQYECAPAR